MPTQPAGSMTEIQAQVERILAIASGPAAQQASVATVEVALFRQLLVLGRQALQLFLTQRAAAPVPLPVTSPAGTPLHAHDRRPITYCSVFGKVTVRRAAYTAPGQPVVCPFDAAVGLPQRCYSDLLRQWATFGATDAAYRETTTLLEQILGLRLSCQALETMMAEDAADVAAFYEQPPAPLDAAATLLVVQVDGKGVPLCAPATAARRRQKGQPPGTMTEAIVTGIYRVAPYARTPAAVQAALLHRAPPAAARPQPRPHPVGKELRATLAGKAAGVSQVAARAAAYDGPTVTGHIALTDGAEALQRVVDAQLPAFTRVLDLLHVLERLWEVANALLGERHPERAAWVTTRLDQVLAGQAADLAAELATLAEAPDHSPHQRAVLQRASAYYQRNAPVMDYPTYLACGWPISTGVIEGACGHLVADRCQQAGMRWTRSGVTPVLDLRAVRLNGDWDRYWAFHSQQAYHRHYGPDHTLPPPPPEHAQLAEAA